MCVTFVFGLGFPRAGFGDGDGRLTLGVKESLLQGPSSGAKVSTWITLPPATKAVLTVSYRREETEWSKVVTALI